MTNGHEPITPCYLPYDSEGEPASKIENANEVEWLYRNGLTKREYFAAMAMQGLASGNEGISYCTERAVQMADALIEELNKQP